MKKLLLLLPILTISTSIPTTLSAATNLNQINNQKMSNPISAFTEVAIVTDQWQVGTITPSTDDYIKVNISKNSITEMLNNQSQIATFVENLNYSNGSAGSVMTNPNFLPDFKKQLAKLIDNNVKNLNDSSSTIGVTMTLQTDWDFSGVLTTYLLKILPYIEYTPTTTAGNFDEVEKYYKFLAHDILKVDISQEGWNWIKTNGNNNLMLRALFDQFPKYDKSGAGGSITDSDIELLATIVIKNWSVIENYFNQSQTKGVKITTNTEGDDVKIGYE